jgi:hypothetical protein
MVNSVYISNDCNDLAIFEVQFKRTVFKLKLKFKKEISLSKFQFTLTTASRPSGRLVRLSLAILLSVS